MRRSCMMYSILVLVLSVILHEACGARCRRPKYARPRPDGSCRRGVLEGDCCLVQCRTCGPGLHANETVCQAPCVPCETGTFSIHEHNDFCLWPTNCWCSGRRTVKESTPASDTLCGRCLVGFIQYSGRDECVVVRDEIYTDQVRYTRRMCFGTDVVPHLLVEEAKPSASALPHGTHFEHATREVFSSQKSLGVNQRRETSSSSSESDSRQGVPLNYFIVAVTVLVITLVVFGSVLVCWMMLRRKNRTRNSPHCVHVPAETFSLMNCPPAGQTGTNQTVIGDSQETTTEAGPNTAAAQRNSIELQNASICRHRAEPYSDDIESLSSLESAGQESVSNAHIHRSRGAGAQPYHSSEGRNIVSQPQNEMGSGTSLPSSRMDHTSGQFTMGNSSSAAVDGGHTQMKGAVGQTPARYHSSAESGIETGSGLQGEPVQESELKTTHVGGTADPMAKEYHTSVSESYESALHKK